MAETENTSGATSPLMLLQRASVSGWLAAAVIIACMVIVIRLPIVLWFTLAEACPWSLGFWLLAIGWVTWLAATSVHNFLRKRRLIWSSAKYAVITFGVSSIWLLCHLQSQLDLESIRSWAGTYQTAQGDSTALNGTVLVPRPRQPKAIAKLNPEMVLFVPDTKTVHIVYGGGFGHWGLSVGPSGSHPSGSQFADGASAWGPRE